MADYHTTPAPITSDTVTLPRSVLNEAIAALHKANQFGVAGALNDAIIVQQAAPITSGDALKTYEMDQAIELLKNVAAIAINMLDVNGQPKTGDTLNMAVKGVEAAYLGTRATDAPAQGEQRELFEQAIGKPAHIKGETPATMRDGDGDYENPTTQYLWNLWQQAQRAASTSTQGEQMPVAWQCDTFRTSDAKRLMTQAHAYAPIELSTPAKMAWMGDFFAKHYTAAPAAVRIPTWRERLLLAGNKDEEPDDALEAMRAEIADLRAALAQCAGAADKPLAKLDLSKLGGAVKMVVNMLTRDNTPVRIEAAGALIAAFGEVAEVAASADAAPAGAVAVRNAALEEAALACEKVQEDFEERDGGKWPELRVDAATGASDCASTIRALKSAAAEVTPAPEAAGDLQRDYNSTGDILAEITGCYDENVALWELADRAREMLAAAKAGAPATAAGSVPDGWAVVPVNPTWEMIVALGWGGDEDMAIGHAHITQQMQHNYAAMLRAVPVAAAQSAEGGRAG